MLSLCTFPVSLRLGRSGSASGEEDEKRHGTCKDNEGMEKHKRKKHKHHSKHKKHKYASAEEKEHRHKHKHKRKKRRRKDSSRVDNGAVEDADETVSVKRSRLDDLAALEDLEKQRALIQAELDNELMEGKVHSGMGLILQGYNSGSDEDMEGQERMCNGDERKENLERLDTAEGQESQSVTKDAEQSQHSSMDDERTGPWRRSRSRSEEKVINKHKSNRKKSRTESDTDTKDRTPGPCPSLEKRPSSNSQQPKDARPKSRSPAISKKQNYTQKDPQAVAGETEQGSKREPSSSFRQSGTRSTDHPKSPERSRRSRSRDRHGRLLEPDRKRDRDKKSAKSPCKEVLSGKENRSPPRRHIHSPARDRSSRRSRERHSPQYLSNSRSATRNRSPARRERSRSTDRRRRESDRQRPSPVRSESNRYTFFCVCLLKTFCLVFFLLLFSILFHRLHEKCWGILAS